MGYGTGTLFCTLLEKFKQLKFQQMGWSEVEGLVMVLTSEGLYSEGLVSGNGAHLSGRDGVYSEGLYRPRGAHL